MTRSPVLSGHAHGDAMKPLRVVTSHRFTDEERHGVYPAIYERRDVCLGYVSAFEPEPELASRGWEHRVPLAAALHFERHGATDACRAHAFAQFSETAGRRR